MVRVGRLSKYTVKPVYLWSIQKWPDYISLHGPTWDKIHWLFYGSHVAGITGKNEPWLLYNEQIGRLERPLKQV